MFTTVKQNGNQAISWLPFVSDARCARTYGDDGKVVINSQCDMAINRLTPGMARRQTFKLMTGFGLIGAGAGMVVLALIGGTSAPTALLITGSAVGGTGVLWMIILIAKNQTGSGRGVRLPYVMDHGKKLGNLIPDDFSIKSIFFCCGDEDADGQDQQVDSSVDNAD